MKQLCGVMRGVIHPGDDGEYDVSGNLLLDQWCDHDDETCDCEPYTDDIVIWTFDETRLREILTAARHGDSDDDIILALEAAALEPHDPERG